MAERMRMWKTKHLQWNEGLCDPRSCASLTDAPEEIPIPMAMKKDVMGMTKPMAVRALSPR